MLNFILGGKHSPLPADQGPNDPIGSNLCSALLEYGAEISHQPLLSLGSPSAKQSSRWVTVLTMSYGLASYTRLNGVWVARRNRVKPAEVTTSLILPSPACAPKHSPTACEREHGVHNRVEKE